MALPFITRNLLYHTKEWKKPQNRKLHKKNIAMNKDPVEVAPVVRQKRRRHQNRPCQ